MVDACVLFIVVACSLLASLSTSSVDRLLLQQHVQREVSTSNNPDFISIDCGASWSYIDKTSDITYQTDEEFTISGTSHRISVEYNASREQLQTLRSFPDGTTNCYTLRPRQGKNNRYLIRTQFKYGNYDGQDKPPQFDLYIGVSKLFTLSTGHSDQEHWIEIVHVPTTNYISFCLVNIGLGVPIISLLELRLLEKSVYQIGSYDTLGLFTRYDIGSSSATLARYNDDHYDRFWDPVKNPNVFFKNWDLISTNLTIDTQSSLYKPPATMLRTAAQATNASVAIEYSQIPIIEEDIYSAFLYFAEIQELKQGQKREMNIFSNGKLVFGPFSLLYYLVPLTVGPIKLPLVGNQLQFSISSTNESGLPPILNGCEIYRTYQLNGMPSNANDIDAIMDIRETYGVTRNWQGDPCVETSWDGLNCSVEANPRITRLNLSSSGLKGIISASISNLTSLRSLDLSQNSLTGPLPHFLAELPALKALNLTGNQLTGSIPQALLDKSHNGTLSLSVSGNPNLCQSSSCGKKSRIFIIAVSTSVSAVVLIVIVVALAVWRIKRKGFPTSASNNNESIESKTQEFTYSQIVSITDNFKTVIGEGGFGKVYLGTLRDGDKVAVKLLSSKSEQGPQEFLQEVKLLIRVHHGNLVKLIGYCNQVKHMGLIYEYMPNGNLKQLLSYNSAAVLRWIHRVKIATQIAQGLDYLHNNCTPPIIHRDLKTVNILLDENLQAKISDFGLSRAFKNEDMTHISTTQTAGTPAYIDPEYVVSGKLNRKSDVYSYGVILLEIVTGQPAIIIRDGEAMSILNWIKPLIERGDIQAVVDPRLAGEYGVDAAWKIIETAFACLEETAIQRPEISYVLDELKQCIPIDRTPTQTTRTGTSRDTSSIEYEPVDIDPDIAFPIAR